MTDPAEVKEIPPADAFSLLGHELRIGIVRALWRAGDDEVSFSKLRERAGMPDSGQFNYHLGELVGTFVRESEEAEGYELTYAGRQVIGAILDGTYTKRASLDAFEIGVDCVTCGASLEARYEAETFYLGCPDCGGGVVEFPLPPGALNGRTLGGFVEMAAHRIRSELSLIRAGVCPTCSGVLNLAVDTSFAPRNQKAGFEYECERCVHSGHGTIRAHLLSHPAVVSFYDDHGIDLSGRWWEVLAGTGEGSTTVRSEEPRRIAVTFALSDDELELIVDDALNVVDRRRT